MPQALIPDRLRRLSERSAGGIDPLCSAYGPDLPGVIAIGKALDKTRERMRNAIDFCRRGPRADGGPVLNRPVWPK